MRSDRPTENELQPPAAAKKLSRPRVAVFGSGAGTTARSLIEATTWACYDVVVVVGSKPGLGLADVAHVYSTPYLVLDSSDAGTWFATLRDHNVDVVALAGWLRKVPAAVVDQLHGRIINVHPSLLPKFGGQGMYGRRVHQAVYEAGETITGVTVHIVTAEYDEGPILAQQECSIASCSSAEEIEAMVRNIEKTLYPKELHRYCCKLLGEQFER